VDNSTYGNVYSALGLGTGNYSTAGTNNVILNTSIAGVYTGINIDGDSDTFTGLNISQFSEDAIHTPCLTNSTISWSQLFDRYDTGYGGHGDWAQIYDGAANCPTTAVANQIIGSVVYVGAAFPSSGGGNGFPFTGGGGGTTWTGAIIRGNTIVIGDPAALNLSNYTNPDISFNTIVQDQSGLVSPLNNPVVTFYGTGTGGTMKYNALFSTTYAHAGGSTQAPTLTNNVVLSTGQYTSAFAGPIYGATAVAGGLAGMQAAFAYKPGGLLDTATTGYTYYVGASPYFNYVTRTRTDPP
jgi:hypothetical protein